MRFLKTAITSLLLVNSVIAVEGKELFYRYNCSSCHAPDRRVVGPSFLEISKRYGQSEKAVETVAKLIIKPKPENWPGMAYMPPYDIPYDEAKALAKYVLIESIKNLSEQKKTEDSIEDILDDDAQFH
ncbi:c-type cytochrome [Persephonella sp.]|uniref:c-type cytochrome n=1 Tax=Persephonella sp. TaxID=2060922 RepID=UPI0025D4DA0C|nr:c-type cytochrome [Persephonella sp.]